MKYLVESSSRGFVFVRRFTVIRAMLGAFLVLAVVVGCATNRQTADFNAGGEPSMSPSMLPSLPPPSPSSSPTPSPSPTFPTLRAPKNPNSIKVSGATLFGWALLDTQTNKIVGSSNDETTRNTVESMIKGWIAADFLRRLDESGKTPTKTQLSDITLMIIDSNNQIAQEYFNLDGRDASMTRLAQMCNLANVQFRPGYWSFLQMTPADAVRYGQCINDGTAAGPKWTKWLLGVMKKVRGGVDDQISDTKQGGRWGIIDGLPESMQDDLSMKNGWTQYRKDGWHVNCLGIEPGWVLSIMLRTSTLAAAADDCATVTKQLVVTR